MINFRKPNSRKKGLKILAYGETGVGKTWFAMTFPKSVVIDSEDGYSWYEGKDVSKNIVGIYDTQNFNELREALEEGTSLKEQGIESFIIDSETKIYENLTEALLDVDEKRARAKGQDVLDANISMRSWGKIKNVAKRLQNKKISVATQGLNVVSIAQSQDVFTGNGDKRVKVGTKPNMQKQTEYDYDVVIELYTDITDNSYKARVIKDRTGAYKPGDVIDNPSYDSWASVINAPENQGETLQKDFNSDSDKAKDEYEKTLDLIEDESKPFSERVSQFVKGLSPEQIKEFKKGLAEKGVKSLEGLTKQQEKSIIKLMSTF